MKNYERLCYYTYISNIYIIEANDLAIKPFGIKANEAV